MEIYRGKPILYDTGDFIDDYAVNRELRNDWSFLFRVSVAEGRFERLDLIPVKLSYARVDLATGGERESVLNRMERCPPRWAPSLPAVKAHWCSNAASAYSFRDLVWSCLATVCALARAGGRPREGDASKGRALVGKNNTDYGLDRPRVVMSFSNGDHESLLLRERVSPWSLTKRAQTIVRRRTNPRVPFSKRTTSSLPPGPKGCTNRPPAASCSSSGLGTDWKAAATKMASYGAYSGRPFVPSPVTT